MRGRIFAALGFFAFAGCAAPVDEPSAVESEPLGDALDDGTDDYPGQTAEALAKMPSACRKGIKVSLRTNYGMEAFDPARQGSNEYPNRCWLNFDRATGLVENIAAGTQGWRSGCASPNGCRHDPPNATHWYYDDTNPTHALSDDIAKIRYTHDYGGNNPGGMKAIKGTVDMARRIDPATGAARWRVLQVDSGGQTNIVGRWFAETHNPVNDSAGRETQNNDYVSDWLALVHATGNIAIRPQLVIISSNDSTENCAAAYRQVKAACALMSRGRTIGMTMEGGVRFEYGHCEGDVVAAINECTCSVHAGCF
ncbi:MAG TPA: hypothetical protein VIF62_34015 [Labilithrix sp.]